MPNSKSLVLTAFICFASFLNATPTCPNWLQDPSVPLCPASSNMLPETFPAIAHVVSTRSIHETRDGEDGIDFAVSYLEALMKTSNQRVPLTFLPVPKEAFDAVKKRLSRSDSVDKALRDQWVNNLVYVPISTSVSGSDYITYQQDYIKGFQSPDSQKTQLRHLKDRPSAGVLGPQLVKLAAKLCPDLFDEGTPIGVPRSAEEGPIDLPPDFGENLSPNYGGNILGMPHGLCLRGANQSTEVARQYCTPRNEVPVDVNWLWVGHVDEVFATVPHPNAKAPCDFAVVRASPKRALTIMREQSKEPFITFPEGTSPETQKQRMESTPFQRICAWNLERSKRSNDDTHNEASTTSRRPEATPCHLMTNGQALSVIENDSQAMEYLNAVEKKMSEETRVLLNAYQKRMKCQPKVIEAPALFYGGPLVKGELPAEMGKSFFPNSANLVPIENNVLSSDPHHRGFRDWMSKSFRELGLNEGKTDQEVFLDTFDQGHVGNGNLHCLTQTFRGCRRQK